MSATASSMRKDRFGIAAVAIALLAGGFASRAEARLRNPYSSFNLSGVNYGAMQWERAQRQGRRVWPYYNAAPQGPSRGAAVNGGTGGFNTRVRRGR